MKTKWLEERWIVFFPALASLGIGQEAQIQALCEAEIAAWRARPSMKQANSVTNPLTRTRKHIRESFSLTEENSWVNPKSGEREHLALKYLAFSTEEWQQINRPRETILQDRLTNPLSLTDPSGLMQVAEHLLRSNGWADLVVGLGLVTGRGLVEVLQTGQFTAKTAYSLLFAGPMTVYEQLCEPFEVPTLVRAELVLEAVRQLRHCFGAHFIGVSRHDISRQCREPVREAIYRHLLHLVPFRVGARNLYTSLARGVYSRLATHYYCPPEVDEIVYMATIQNQRQVLEANSEEERLMCALETCSLEYVIVDPQGKIDHRRGIRLGEPGVQVVEVFHQR